nr:hypothetical protein [Tanacetum cinerariifolium]
MGRDTVQLETTINTISHEYLLEFTSEYGIPETLHLELPRPGDRIVDFAEGKGGCPSAKGRGRILTNVTPSHWILSKIGTIASFGSTRECFRPSWTGGRMPPKTRCLLRAHMDLFNLIRALNPTKVKIGSRPRAPHEVPLLTLTANRVVEMDDPAAVTDSSGLPSTIERSPLDFSLEAEASDQGTAAPGMPPSEDVPATVAPGTGQAEEVAAADPPAAAESRKKGRDGIDSLAPIHLGLASTASVPEDAPTGVSDPDPLSFTDPPARPPTDVAQSSPGIVAAGDPESKNASSPVEVGSSGSVYRPEWGVTNGSLLDTPEACQDLVDHAAPPCYFFELRHMHNEEFLGQYNVNLARQVAMGSQLRLRFEQEAKLLRKSIAQVARCYPTRAEFKRYEDDRVERQCAELDARLDALSIDFDEELYPHMLTAIAGRRWVIGYGLRLAVMKCGESLDMRQAFTDVVSAGITKALQELKDLKYPLLDQLKGLKDAPIDVIMASFYLESDTGEDASQYIRDLCPSSPQLTIPVCPKVRDPQNLWAYKEEMKLADAIAANISRAVKKKKCRIVCRTHGVGSAHHARSDSVRVSVPTVVPQGLALLLANAATQTECKDT